MRQQLAMVAGASLSTWVDRWHSGGEEEQRASALVFRICWLAPHMYRSSELANDVTACTHCTWVLDVVLNVVPKSGSQMKHICLR